ncbi:MAG: hypothetical protein WC725_05625 [Patescibacteria group bacterium]
MVNKIEKKLKNKQAHIGKLIKERNVLLRELRLQCKHLFVAECEYEEHHYIDSFSPRRICVDCGAEEEGWGCGYQVLGTSRGEERVEVRMLRNREDFYKYRKQGPLYLVGQSHPNFKEHGPKTYEQLTEIKEE